MTPIFGLICFNGYRVYDPSFRVHVVPKALNPKPPEP